MLFKISCSRVQIILIFYENSYFVPLKEQNMNWKFTLISIFRPYLQLKIVLLHINSHTKLMAVISSYLV